MCRDPSTFVSSVHSAHSNRRPRSVVIVDGVPKSAIYPLMKASANDCAVMLVRG